MSTARLLRSDRGVALVVVLSVLFALSLIALASVQTSETELSIAGNKTRRTQSLLAAEAGMARTDFVMLTSPQVTSAAALLGVINSDTLLPNASFMVAMDTTLPRRKVICLGKAGDGRAAIQVQYEHCINRRSIWNHAVFSGSGDNGRPVTGPLVAHGPVHLLAGGELFVDGNANGVWNSGESYTDVNHDGQYDPPTSSDSVSWDLSGTAQMLNSSSGMPGKLSSRVPTADVTQFGGESVRTLHAELRVAHGRVRLSGGSEAGQSNVTGGTPALKETLDAVYVEDGFTGSSAAGSVFSDNGVSNGYDFDTPPAMPNLDAPYTDSYGVPYTSYMAYLRANALVISGDLNLRDGQSMPLQASGFGSISVNSSGEVQGDGIIYVEGKIHVLDFGDVHYDGEFTLVSEGDVVIDEDLLSKDGFVTNDVLGIISHGRIVLGTANDQPEVTAALFAQEQIHVQDEDTFIAGAVVSNRFNLIRPCHVYFIPSLVENMPPGMPGTLGQTAKAWRRVPRSWVELD